MSADRAGVRTIPSGRIQTILPSDGASSPVLIPDAFLDMCINPDPVRIMCTCFTEYSVPNASAM